MCIRDRHGAEVVDPEEFGVLIILRAEQTREIMLSQLLTLGRGERYVGIEEHRREVVLRQAGTKALEIDEADFTAPDDDILALEIAVDETARERGQFLGNRLEPGAIETDGESEVLPEAMLDEVILLPAIKRSIELLLQVKL